MFDLWAPFNGATQHFFRESTCVHRANPMEPLTTNNNGILTWVSVEVCYRHTDVLHCIAKGLSWHEGA